MSIPRLTQNVDNSLAFTKDAIGMTNYENDYVFRGKCYGLENFVTVGSEDSEYDIVFDTTNVKKKMIVALPTHWYEL